MVRFQPSRFCLLLMGACLLAGCIEKVPPNDSRSADAGNADSQAPIASGSPASGGENSGTPPAVGPMPGAGSPGGGAASTGSNADVWAQKAKDLESQLAKASGDPRLKKQLAEALSREGESIMNDQSLMPRQKYPTALRLFRRALTYDPQQATALDGKNAIESIYKQMGMPIPD